MAKAQRTKAVEIPTEVKKAVAKRDSIDGWCCCVYCGKPTPPANPLAFSNAHFIPRSHGGLGIEENIWTGCVECHRDYDQSPIRYLLRERLIRHFRSKYPEWDKTELTYRKGM